MFIREQDFDRLIESFLQGRAHPHVIIASHRLADTHEEGEHGKGDVRITVCHSVQNAAHIRSHTNGSNSDHIYVLYASQSGYHTARAVAFTLNVSEPTSTVIVVTCTCDEQVKRTAFAQAVRENTISAVVFTHDCGANSFMRDLIGKLQKPLVHPQSP